MTCEPTIHVIDDDPAILASLGLLLTAEGYAVHTHQSAQIFLDAIRQSDSGCVVTDIDMPEINGLDLLAEMKERRVSMPVIIMTGQGNAQLVVAAMIHGAFDSPSIDVRGREQKRVLFSLGFPWVKSHKRQC
jgi:two-component system response regulator FixJ